VKMDKAGAGHGRAGFSLCTRGAIAGRRENAQRADSLARWCGLVFKESTHRPPFAAAIRLFPRA
jgi:hypothetical protein